MKVSREQAAANRERIVDVASNLFREKGFDGIGLVDLMNRAGLTHGGFYGHFKSKDHLVEEACSRAMTRASEKWNTIAEVSEGDAFSALVENYLSKERLSTANSSCLFSALGSEVYRQKRSVRRVFSDGFEKLTEILARAVTGRTTADRRKKAIAAFAEMVGAVVLARSVDEPALAAEILQTVTADLKSRQA